MKPELIELTRKTANARNVPAEQVLAVMQMYSGGEKFVDENDPWFKVTVEEISKDFNMSFERVIKLLKNFTDKFSCPSIQYNKDSKPIKLSGIDEKYQFIYCCSLGLGLIPVKEILMPEIMFRPEKHLWYLKNYCLTEQMQIHKVCDLVESCQVRFQTIESINNIAALKRGIRDKVVSVLPETYELVNLSRKMKKSIIQNLEGDDEAETV